MRHLILSICLVANVGFCFERAQLDTLIQAAATNCGPEYLAARVAITSACAQSPGFLMEAANDKARTWQHRLVARIAYERIFRGQDIEALRNYNWEKDPAFEAKWLNKIVGPIEGVRSIAIPEMVQYGLWYYYIELNWKNTREVTVSAIPRLKGDWAWWCREAVGYGPERIYLNLAMIERVEKDGPSVESFRLYETLMNGCREAVPVLVKFYDQYNKRTMDSLEAYRGENAQIYAKRFGSIVALADNSHVDLLQKFMVEHEPLSPMTNRLEEVRARPAASALFEPCFRLGTNAVVEGP